jgi:hypothetical protein
VFRFDLIGFSKKALGLCLGARFEKSKHPLALRLSISSTLLNPQ